MTKTLYLVRHAKSSWTDMSLGDFNRPLNKRGLRDAPEMGKRLKDRKIMPGIILCSPAQRARQTAGLLFKDMGGSMDTIQFDEQIYEASADTLMDLIRNLPDNSASAMIIGHNPSMGWLANQLADSHMDRMPTCAIATLELETSHWRDAGTCASRLLDFDYPNKAE